LLAAITGKQSLMAKLLYGCGLRLLECIRLRIQDVDIGQGLIFVGDIRQLQSPLDLL
jgi:integrase